ncbi:hypothetical protein D7006_17320 [Xanthobacter sp. YC-JY1]|nr:hypothetical protein D7006_17320 [Xanthobacter sp. YC-JY1]
MVIDLHDMLALFGDLRGAAILSGQIATPDHVADRVTNSAVQRAQCFHRIVRFTNGDFLVFRPFGQRDEVAELAEYVFDMGCVRQAGPQRREKRVMSGRCIRVVRRHKFGERIH